MRVRGYESKDNIRSGVRVLISGLGEVLMG